jgi:hypothetical protein
MTRRLSVSVTILFAIIGSGTGCGGCDNGGGDGVEPDATGQCGSTECAEDEVCRYGVCLPDPPACVDGECQGDHWCDPATDECLPWEVGPSGDLDEECVRVAVPGVFVPGVQCEWVPEEGDAWRNVLGAPMVADFGGPGGGEFSLPYIVFVTYNGSDGGLPAAAGTDPALYGKIRIVDGRTCDLLYTIDTPTVLGAPSVALGDLTGDRRAEIVAARTIGGLVAFTHDPDQDAWEVLWETDSQLADAVQNWAGPSIHDLDDDGDPEVLHYGGVYDGATGDTLDEALSIDNPNSLETRTTGYIPVVADTDADGVVELITGTTRYAWDAGNTMWVATGQPLGPAMGRTAVADFGTFVTEGADDRATLDGIAEVVVVTSNVMRVRSIAGHEIFQAPFAGSGGPPTIADFDGDGRVEVAVAGATAYTVFDYDCRPGTTEALCPSLRDDFILWTQPSQDASSNTTGSSVFDFEGDGRAEVVYADECFTRVYDGASGEVMYSHYRTSCTWHELPIVADVDGDFNAEIVVGSNDNCNTACPPGSDAPYLDPSFDGVACLDDSDCPGTTTCGREEAADPLGRCRCVEDVDCGSEFVCRDRNTPSPVGRVCRAEHPASSVDDNHGIRVLSDSLDRWVNTRRIWNQHAYSVTNVDDDGTIPRTRDWLRNWEVSNLNNFRQNAPGEGIGDGQVPTPDLTVRSAAVTCGGEVTITADVCNRGTEPVAPGVPVAIYQAGVPAAVCATVTEEEMQPGECTEVACSFAASDGDHVVVVDDDGAGEGANSECRGGNNALGVDVDC